MTKEDKKTLKKVIPLLLFGLISIFNYIFKLNTTNTNIIIMYSLYTTYFVAFLGVMDENEFKNLLIVLIIFSIINYFIVKLCSPDPIAMFACSDRKVVSFYNSFCSFIYLMAYGIKHFAQGPQKTKKKKHKK